MSWQVATPEECREFEIRLRHAVRVFDFSLQQRLVLDLLVDRTFARDRCRTLFPSLAYFARFLGIHTPDASRVVRQLEEEFHVIGSAPALEFISRSNQNPRWYWVHPEPTNWRNIGPRVDRQFVAQMHRDLDLLESSQGRLTTPSGEELVPGKLPG